LIKKENFQLKKSVQEPTPQSIFVDEEIGIVVNISMDGIYRNVKVQSQVIFINNLGVDLNLMAANAKGLDERCTISAGSAFPIPFGWLLDPWNISIFI